MLEVDDGKGIRVFLADQGTVGVHANGYKI